jgi:prepilin-type N-terminal cleavage/methylation domain-containing protein
MKRGFSMIELLVCVAVIAVLLSLLLPTLAGARDAMRTTRCEANHKQLITGWTAYANDYRDRVMPLAYWSAQDIGTGEQIFWWGTYGSGAGGTDHDRGFIAPYLGSPLSQRSVFECPSQPWGTYVPQGGAQSPTSTYGYNGYYLSPSRTPGWGSMIGTRPWRRLSEIERPCELFVFADTLLAMEPARNCALLDPPWLWDGFEWYENDSPTTAFRHQRPRSGEGVAAVARADGSAAGVRARPEWLVTPELGIGSVGVTNDPHYVPDAARW